MRTSSITRRGVLAAAGTALFAGCSELDRFDEDENTIRSADLSDLRDDDVDPIVVETLPIEIERTTLKRRLERVDSLLGRLPVPFGTEDVPNGYVRAELLEAASEATEYVEDARTGQSRLSALQSLRRARSNARYAATGAAFVDGDTTRAAVEADHRAAVDDADAMDAEHEYVGLDPIEATLVHARIERNLERIVADRDPSRHGYDDELLTVAAWGEHAESAAALLDDSRYLYDRFRSSLPEDAGTVDATLQRASESLAADIRRRRDELPDESPDRDDVLSGRIRYRLWDDAASSHKRVEGSPGPASAVLAATEGLTDLSAYDRVQARADDGERFRVETTEDVRNARSRAHDAIRMALEESPRADLARPVLARTAATVTFADEELTRISGSVRPSRFDRSVRRYVIATARAKSVPGACQTVIEALDGSPSMMDKQRHFGH